MRSKFPNKRPLTFQLDNKCFRIQEMGDFSNNRRADTCVLPQNKDRKCDRSWMSCICEQHK